MVEGAVVSAHAWQFFAICGAGIGYFMARHRVILWWRARDPFAKAIRDLIDADARALKARGK